MHIEILIEDQSGQKALEVLIQQLVPADVTYKFHCYKGIGRIPPNMKDAADPAKRILLTNLPKLLKGYGRTFHSVGPNYPAAVVLVCDLDDKNLNEFLTELLGVLEACDPKPDTRFCIAIEEGEAWLLGDIAAIIKAYPNAHRGVLAAYENDSICGTWEKLADAIYPGGAKVLAKKDWYVIGAEKMRWATAIPPHMDIEANKSPSFRFFRDAIRSLVGSKSPQKLLRPDN